MKGDFIDSQFDSSTKVTPYFILLKAVVAS